MADPATLPGMLKLVFEENCVVVDDTEEYYFDSIEALKTVGQLCAFLEGQESFPKDKKVMPFSVKGRKIGSKEAAASTVAFIKIEAGEGIVSFRFYYCGCEEKTNPRSSYTQKLLLRHLLLYRRLQRQRRLLLLQIHR